MSAERLEEKVCVGRLGAAHGVRGWLKLISFTDPLDAILEYQPWLIQSESKPHDLTVEKVQQGDHQLLVKLKGCDDRDRAKTLTNLELWVYRHQLPELDSEEYYWADLIGLSVIDEAGKKLGELHAILPTGSNDVFLVKNGEKEFAVPYLDDFVKSIDLENRCVHISGDWD